MTAPRRPRADRATIFSMWLVTFVAGVIVIWTVTVIAVLACLGVL